MTVITPPLYLNVDSEYGAADLGLPWRDLIAEGVVGSTALAVSQRAAGANLSVDVAAGVAWIKGDSSSTQPCYRCENDGTVNLAIAAADATNPRIDRVVAEVRDSVFSGVSNDWRLRVITGTPAGSPSAPAIPDSAISLATVSVPALDTTISTGQITDTRPLGGLQGAMGVPTVTSLPAAPYDGQVVDYLADATNSVVWRLKYRAGSASAYKWEWIGGGSLRAELDTLGSTTSLTYVDFPGAGLSLTAPLAGDYQVEWYALFGHSVGTAYGIIAPKVGAAATADANGILCQTEVANCNVGTGNVIHVTVSAASTAIKMQYKTASATMTINTSVSGPSSYLMLRPVRVG